MYMNARQMGRGGITVFHGFPVSHAQHGGGLGSIFKSVARVVVSGENVKAATKRRESAAFQQAKQDALMEVKRRRGPSTTTTTTTEKKE